MSVDYSSVAEDLLKSEPSIRSITIIEGQKEIVYSTTNWDIEGELELILSIWTAVEIKPIPISRKKFSVLQASPERLVATSFRGEGHVVAAKDDKRKIIVQVAPNGDMHDIYSILVRTLKSLSPKELYMHKDAVLGKDLIQKRDADFRPPESKPLTEEDEIELKEKINLAAQWIVDSKYLIFFTGAGLSTESGIPDFRGPGGLWTRRDQGLRPLRPYPEDLIKPNSGHMAIVELLKMGKVDYVISQNADGLHLESGIPPEKLAELHGNKNFMVCLECDRKMTYEEAKWDRNVWGPGYKQIPVQEGQPTCPYCQGRIISSVVAFGQKLPYDELYESMKRSEKADLYFVVGSSCAVTPAANLVKLAKENGAKLIILNLGETPYDMAADMRFFNKIGNVLPPIVENVKGIMKIK